MEGEIPERPKGTDCKSVGSAFTGSNPVLPTILGRAGVAQLARATAFQAVGCEFEPRLPHQITLGWHSSVGRAADL